ncbi:hypothetical protein [Mucilaginibacter jinjuensis]|uniref:Uncharacterized protein n=1 Tax=Mucilaginibacter jinjuensis TaxID=1176721 RepID=A0ABY7T0R3_9SPHI|nr:hypothetical protein [Mucilaginibacter jinjuensis]WCT10025.1 hypothetical protein PQO05_14930 [Mucilaginibacter jinjuensis]
MNSYNENLNATVVASLQALDLDEKNLQSQFNSSMFTLYHAEGATITADDKLTNSKSDLKFKNTIKQIAVVNTNISNNLVSTATQADQYLKQAVTNAAVGASNVQIAANSIVRLASDIGSIFSIINAADFDTDVFHQAQTVAAYMNETAYEAEVASKIAMDVSKYTSQVTSSIVLDKAKTTNASIKNLLKITSADYEAASQSVIADNATQVEVSANEKVAEGALEDICINYIASKFAYYSTNAELNLNLVVDADTSQDSIDNDLFLAQNPPKPPLSITVSFDTIKTPFAAKDNAKRPTYPVETYYVFVVKESKKDTFSISNAEELVNGTTRQYVSYPRVITEDGDPAFYDQLTYKDSKISGLIYSQTDKDNKGDELHDSDDDAITVGESYVVFVMAAYYNDYKKTLNDFDDFLSAPSRPFCMKNKLQKVKNTDIVVGKISANEKNISLEAKFTAALSESTKNDISTNDGHDKDKLSYSMQLTFDVDEPLLKGDDIQYRCIFLPEPGDVTNGMLNSTSLKSLIEIEYVILQNIDSQDIIKGSKSQVTKSDALQGLVAQRHSKPGFFFNLPLAEQVSAGNYSPAIKYDKPADSSKKLSATATQGEDNAAKPTTTSYITFIGPDTTDNFGNLLVANKKYVPVIVSVATVSEDEANNYSNAISDFENKAKFSYTK